MSLITGFHHVCIHARRDYGAAVAFYRDALGLPQRVEFSYGGRRASLFDAGGGNYIEIFDYTGEPADSVPATLSHLALRTPDVDALIARLAEAGVAVTVQPVTIDLPTTIGPNPFTIRIAFFVGPEGESVELFDEVTPLAAR